MGLDPNDDFQLWLADCVLIFFAILYFSTALGIGLRLFRFCAGL